MILYLLAALAIDGTVVNRTTGKAAPEAPVVLMRLGDGGMMPVGTVKASADGKFKFEQGVDGAYLLQATYEGVTYNKMLRPGEAGTGLELEVFSTTKDRSVVRIVQHMMLVEPNDGKLSINESVIFRNNGKSSYLDPANGSYKFVLPAEAKGAVEVRVTGSGGMPTNRDAVPAGAPDTFKIEYPIKPGESRFDLQYSMPFTTPGKFSSRILHEISDSEGVTRIVTPSGVTLKGAGVEDLGAEPQTQAQVYALTKQQTEIEVTGTGSLRALEADESGSPEPQAILPKLMERQWWILGLSLFALGLGFVALLKRA
jgi:hypothetical protein